MNKNIVINGFSADALVILASKFNSISKRKRFITKSGLLLKDVRDGHRCINKSAFPILVDICAFIGIIHPFTTSMIKMAKEDIVSGQMVLFPFGGDYFFINSLDLLCFYPRGRREDDYTEAIAQAANLFNAKAKRYGVSARLEFGVK